MKSSWMTARLPGCFVALRLAIGDVGRALDDQQGPASPVDVAKLSIVTRALVILQAAHLLLEEGHWEVASGAARQLYELVLNVDYIVTSVDTDAAWADFMTYGLASDIRARKRKLEYAIADGYDDAEGKVREYEDFLADPVLDAFKTKGRLRDNWTGLSTKQLAEKSKHPERLRQYEYYFRSWSEEVHANSPELARASSRSRQ